MILDPRFKLYFLINLNEKKEAKYFFVLNYNNYFLKFKSTLQNTNLNQLESRAIGPFSNQFKRKKRKKSIYNGKVFRRCQNKTIEIKKNRILKIF